MVLHCVHRPPKSCCLFTVDEAETLHKYVYTTYFKHYKLYQHVLIPPCTLDLISKTYGVEIFVPTFPPLRLAGVAREEQTTHPTEESVQTQKSADEVQPAEAGDAQPKSSAVDEMEHPDGLQKQLKAITSEVTSATLDMLQKLEEKVAELEAKQQEAKETKGKGKRK
eukprot:Sspe_Gene.82017::Locus_53506_Transcript_1_1_Confidence_1.000_Length_583::g.82017::m.82017